MMTMYLYQHLNVELCESRKYCVFTDIDADNARDDAAYDGSTFGIEGIIDRLMDNEYKDEIDYSMSMEEYRLTYAQDFLKGGVFDEGTIIKKTRHEVDRQIFSQSDTTVTTVTDEFSKRFL